MYRFDYMHFVDMDEPAIEALGRFRHRVFIRRLGWEVTSSHQDASLEFDGFDGPGTLYVVARDTRARILGCTRLLPTTRPFLLGSVFPQLCAQAPDVGPHTWEISRYAAMSSEHPGLGMELFRASIRFAAAHGAHAVVAVTTCALQRYFERHQVLCSRLGQPVRQGRHTLVALTFPAAQFSAAPSRLPSPVAAPTATPCLAHAS